MFQGERGQKKLRCPLEREFFRVRAARGIASPGGRDRHPQSNRAEMGISVRQIVAACVLAGRFLVVSCPVRPARTPALQLFRQALKGVANTGRLKPTTGAARKPGGGFVPPSRRGTGRPNKDSRYLLSPGFHRESFGMLDDIHREIYVQIRPVKMTGRWFFHVENLAHGNVLEPGEVLVRHEQLTIAGKEPDAVRGDVRDLNHGRLWGSFTLSRSTSPCILAGPAFESKRGLFRLLFAAPSTAAQSGVLKVSVSFVEGPSPRPGRAATERQAQEPRKRGSR